MVLKLGKYSYAHEYKEVGDEIKETIVGNFSSINSLTVLGFNDKNYKIGNISNYPFYLCSPDLFEINETNIINSSKITRIGNDVWIGSGVTINNGVKIGDGVIIAYNSYVTEDIPPYCIVGGNPAKIIKKRYNDEIIEKLVKIQWWNWPDIKIKQNKEYFLNKSINEFVEKFY